MTDTLVTIHGVVRTLIIVAALVSLYAIVSARKAGGWTRLLDTSTQVYAGLRASRRSPTGSSAGLVAKRIPCGRTAWR